MLPSKYLEEAVEQISTLPGIGKKTALRLALNILKRSDNDVNNFGQAIINMKKNVGFCNICHNVSDHEICEICSDASRDNSTICVVEDLRDVIAIESTEQYKGLYHVLGGIISPMDGITPTDLNFQSLFNRISKTNPTEIILALNTTMEGDTTCYYVFKHLNHLEIKISVIARGVAVGDEIEYTDEITLGRSIINRTPYEILLAR